MRVELKLSKPELTPNAERAEERAKQIALREEYGDLSDEEIAQKEKEKAEVQKEKHATENPPSPKDLGKFRPESYESYGDQISTIDKSTKICK